VKVQCINWKHSSDHL